MGTCCGYLNNCSSEPIALSKDTFSDKILYVIESDSESKEIEENQQEKNESPSKTPETKAKKTNFLNNSPKSLRLSSRTKEDAVDYTKSFTYKKDVPLVLADDQEEASPKRRRPIEPIEPELDARITKLISKANYKHAPSLFHQSRSFLEHSLSSEDEMEDNENKSPKSPNSPNSPNSENSPDELAIEAQAVFEKEEEERKASELNMNFSISIEDPNTKSKTATSKEKETTNNSKQHPLNESSQNFLSGGTATATLTLKSEKKPVSTTLLTGELTSVNKNSNASGGGLLEGSPTKTDKPRKSLLKCRSIGRNEKSNNKKKKVKFTGEIKVKGKK